MLPLTYRMLEITEKYTLLAAIHDAVLKGVEKLGLWHVPGEARRSSDVIFVFDIESGIEKGELDDAETEVRLFLTDVERDLDEQLGYGERASDLPVRQSDGEGREARLQAEGARLTETSEDTVSRSVRDQPTRKGRQMDDLFAGILALADALEQSGGNVTPPLKEWAESLASGVVGVYGSTETHARSEYGELPDGTLQELHHLTVLENVLMSISEGEVASEALALLRKQVSALRRLEREGESAGIPTWLGEVFTKTCGLVRTYDATPRFAEMVAKWHAEMKTQGWTPGATIPSTDRCWIRLRASTPSSLQSTSDASRSRNSARPR